MSDFIPYCPFCGSCNLKITLVSGILLYLQLT